MRPCMGQTDENRLELGEELKEELQKSQLDTQITGFLGWASEWEKEPEIVRKCKHGKQIYNVDAYVKLISCEKCNFWYKVKSNG